MSLIAIDPGASGGICWRDADGIVNAEPMPPTMPDIVDKLREISAANPGVTAVVELVGFFRPGNSATAAVKFARHCGHVDAALYACGIPSRSVAPHTWQKALGALPPDKTARKNAIKERVQRSHPHIKVTLATADALGILAYAEALK